MNRKKRLKSFAVAFFVAFAMMLGLIFTVPHAMAFQFDLGPGWRGSLDNTLKYSAGFRVEDQDSALLASPENDDGDRNFDTGLISNRVDILSELDISYKTSFGIRVSGAAWYDTVYNTDNDNDSPATSNAISVDHDEFVDDTEELHGRKAEILDGFVWVRGSIGKMLGTLRAGRHTLMWGESLFMASNGISYGQAPTDVIKAAGVPGSQVKEILMPVLCCIAGTAVKPGKNNSTD